MTQSPWQPPLYQQVAADLRRRIRSGELEPGSALPSETAMHQEYGISRPTIRRVVGLLRSEGLVITVQGSGTFVRAVRHRHQVMLPPGTVLTARMPTPEEMIRFGLPTGVPVLVLQRGRHTTILPADRVIVRPDQTSQI
jgi:DNA-binding GntR family transcriptional regulator